MRSPLSLFSATFPGRVTPYPDEPPYALLLRTAEHNGFYQPYTTFLRAGVQRGRTVSDLSADRVAFLCQQKVEDVARAAPIVTALNVTIGGETLDRDQFIAAHRRWCPACLEERPYHRVWWDVLAVSACPDHGLAIVETCECRRPRLWKSTLLMGCGRGHRFAEAPRTPAPASEIAISAYVRDRICGNPRAPMPILDGLGLGEAIRVMERVGRASARPDLALSRRKGNRAGLASEGFRIMEDFAPRIDEVFDRLRAAPSKRQGSGQWGMLHSYGDFYAWITSYPDGSAFAEAIKRAVADHAARNIVLKSGQTVAGVEVSQSERVEMAVAAKMWGMTFRRFRLVAEAVGLISKSSLRGRAAGLDPEAVRVWAVRFREAKSREEVGSELRIAPYVVASMIREGLLPTIVNVQDEQTKRTAILLLPGDAAERLLEQLAAVAIPSDGAPDLLPLSEAARCGRAPLKKLIPLALAGKLTLRHAQGQPGLDGFLMRRGEAQVAMRRLRVPGMTMREARMKLGLFANMAAQLRECGMLKTTKHGKFFVVSTDEFERFKAAYVTAGELASAFDLPCGQSATFALRRAGVAPVCDSDRFIQVLYRRDEAVEALSMRSAPDEKPDDDLNAIGVPEAIDAETFAKAVGIAPQMVTHLVTTGMVTPLVAGDRRVFSPQAVTEFRTRYATATELSKTLSRNGAAVTPLFRRLGVKPIYDGPHFGSALYPRAEAEAAIARHLADEAKKDRAAAADDEPRKNRRETYTDLGCAHAMLQQLREAGLIKAERHRNAFVYRRSEIKRFQSRYVFGTELGEMIGRHGVGGSKIMLDVLRGLGVNPICSRPEFYTYLFDRAEAMEALKGWDGVQN